MFSLCWLFLKVKLSLGKRIGSYWFKMSCLSCLVFICVHCFFSLKWWNYIKTFICHIYMTFICMNKPYFYRNFFLIDWRHKRLKNTIDLLYFTENTLWIFGKWIVINGISKFPYLHDENWERNGRKYTVLRVRTYQRKFWRLLQNAAFLILRKKNSNLEPNLLFHGVSTCSIGFNCEKRKLKFAEARWALFIFVHNVSFMMNYSYSSS